MIKYDKKVLLVGFGSVAQCTLPIFFKRVNVPYQNVTVIDFEDKQEQLQPWINRGVTYVRLEITRENMAEVLGTYLANGDLLIDLAWNIGAEDIIQWCHDHGVLYINTSVELWDPYTGAANKHPTERTLYHRHMSLEKMVKGWATPGPTAVIEHGANPGLISHFTKQGLIDIANQLIKDKKVVGKQVTELRKLIKSQSFNLLAMKLGVKVIHVSERDTQITNRPKEVNEFVNTWSVEGFREEGTTTSELGWGTHEKTLPAFAFKHAEGPKNQICIARMGMNVWVSSWVPNYCIQGMVVRHGEAFTLSERLTVWKGKKAVYRPTVHYAYCPSDSAIASLNELRGYGYKLQPKTRILQDDIIRGADILGALIMGHAYTSWWTGSDLSIEESRLMVPHQNATTMQVAISVVAASMWMIENPNRGFCTPEDLPHDYILKIAKPYLGKWISVASDWTPLKHYANAFDGYNKPSVDLEDPWQFKNFLISDGD
ncbi:MAG: saccharopine dehydrogenase NADP-binding domain-containing protein [Firmicutes bacterium]|nr:saccharopine dehydrogenase NADP-binding domain-containing protein [Bacillota bacterium]